MPFHSTLFRKAHSYLENLSPSYTRNRSYSRVLSSKIIDIAANVLYSNVINLRRKESIYMREKEGEDQVHIRS